MHTGVEEHVCIQVFKSAQSPLGISFLTNVPQPEVKEADRLQVSSTHIY
jgi:hypothetical protein